MNSRASKAVKNIIILVIILVLPGFLYYLLTLKGKNRYKPLPFFGPKVVAKTGHTFHGHYIPDTIYHKLSDFSLTDQNGKPVTLKTFDNRIFVISLFYTHCPEVCGKVNSNIDSLVRFYAKNRMVYFASVSVDPKDDPNALAKYAAQYSESRKWLFLSGDTTTVYNLARKGLLFNAASDGSGHFMIEDKVALIDQDKRIRGYYSGSSMADMNRLNDEIKVLIAEELRKIKAPEM
jgi:protein SCO1/2